LYTKEGLVQQTIQLEKYLRIIYKCSKQYKLSRCFKYL